MLPHQWLLLTIYLLGFIYAIAEASSQLISKHKIQIYIDGAREHSWFNRRLLPAAAGSLRAHLNLGKLLFLIIWASMFISRWNGKSLVQPLVAAAAILALYYIPVAIAALKPRRLLKIMLPVVLLFSPLIHIIAIPRDWIFNNYRSKSRQQNGSHPENEEEEVEHIRAYIGEAEEEGLFEPDEAEMVRQVIEFSDTVVKEIMTPRVNIECVDKSMPLNTFATLAGDLKYSRYPVIDGKIDNVAGVVHIKSLLTLPVSEYEDKTVADLMNNAHFVPESKKVSLLLRDFQASKQQLAVVVDEYGGTAGIITLEDILEEIVGEIEDEHDIEENLDVDIVETTDGSLEVSGNVDVSEIEKIFEVTMDDESYETVSGFALSHLKHIPEPGENFVTPSGVEVEILQADEKSITKLRLRKVDNNE